MADNKNGNEERDQYFEDRAGTENARFHAVPYEGSWAVKKEGEDEPVSTHDSKSEAAEEAKKQAKEAGTMAILHDEEGQIETQENYQEE